MTTHDAAAARPLILVVDDVGDNREMYAEFLEYEGYQVAQARTGVEALALAQNVAPALIVMDLSMPGMDGWEAARRLKADARTKSIPVLVVSAHALRGTEERAREAGADSFLRKPCLPEDLSAKVAAMLTPPTTGPGA
jgi:two-component system cell cycle response regulator DivK